jgi:hypothetical protein
MSVAIRQVAGATGGSPRASLGPRRPLGRADGRDLLPIRR